MSTQNTHWADKSAEQIVRRKGEREEYVCASGITPSGTVHIGNFREIISVELVVRALRDRGLPVKFIYSWDDYDVFRKVPKNVPEQDRLAEYLRMPITMVPDTLSGYGSYAEANEKELEALLPVVGVEPQYIYQAARYQAGEYAEGIRTALEHRETIRRILDEHRTEPLPEDWWPVSVFSTFTNRDTTTVLGWDGEWGLTYRCEETGREETLDLRSTGAVKLLWRVDWPMRWQHEGVTFEPAGKDHHSEGGSFDTGRKIVAEVYGGEAPVSFQYDFVRIKGRGGKISSSSGEVVGLAEVLEVYQPEVVRYLFAGTKPNSEFAVSFDLDVLKIYEDYDKCERIYFGEQEVGEKKRQLESRVYELSQVHGVPERMPVQIPFRHLCNLLQIHSGDIKAVLDRFELSDEQRRRLAVRAQCAWNWISRFSPEDFRFRLQTPEDPPAELNEAESAAMAGLRRIVESLEDYDEKSLGQAIYDAAREAELEPKELFAAAYRVLIGKEKGPRLAGFIMTVGKERVLQILRRYG